MCPPSKSFFVRPFFLMSFSPGGTSQRSEALAPTINCVSIVEPLLRKKQGSLKRENLLKDR
jgi:hypothetical protein